MSDQVPLVSTASAEPIVDQAERRKNRRFLLRQPATLRYHDGAMRELKADTLNASLKGMLLTAEQGLPSGVELEVTLTLQKGGLQGIALHATGRVVRQQARSAGKSAIAIAFQGRLS